MRRQGERERREDLEKVERERERTGGRGESRGDGWEERGEREGRRDD